MDMKKITELMISGDAFDNFKAQYYYIVKRANQLRKAMKEVETDKIGGFDDKISVDMLTWELKTLDQLIFIMKRRAEQEDLDIFKK